MALDHKFDRVTHSKLQKQYVDSLLIQRQLLSLRNILFIESKQIRLDY